jgi:hypothetical protein
MLISTSKNVYGVCMAYIYIYVWDMYGLCMEYVEKTTGITSTRYLWCTTRMPEEKNICGN